MVSGSTIVLSQGPKEICTAYSARQDLMRSFRYPQTLPEASEVIKTTRLLSFTGCNFDTSSANTRIFVSASIRAVRNKFYTLRSGAFWPS